LCHRGRKLAGDPAMLTYAQVVAIQPIFALVFGILILLIPRLLSSLVGAYLILIGIIGLWPQIVH
jgi:DUF3096 family protein